MSCRMIIAVGQFQTARLLDDFKLMALSRNERHELNKNNCNFIHDSGWGIVLGKSGTLRELYKKEIPCWKDPRFLEYYNAPSDFVIVHARKASEGNPIDLSYTHPFEREGWYFCHNGTVTEFLSKERRDSEKLFTLLLDRIRQDEDVREAIKNVVKQIKDYTALNFILANDRNVYILIRYQKNPEYYTMKYLKSENYIIVSSEILPDFDGNWMKLENDTLIMLDIISRHAELSKLQDIF